MGIEFKWNGRSVNPNQLGDLESIPEAGSGGNMK